MQVVEAPGPGGPIETWIASPAGAGDAALPTIVDVHGGPLGAWAPAPSLEVVLLCARGYRVVLPNIRGSASYGGDWIEPQLGEWGGPDADDVHAALDHVDRARARRPGAARRRSGCRTAGSWSTGSSGRPTASAPPCPRTASRTRSPTWANSDTGPEYCRATLMGDPHDARGRRASCGASRRCATSGNVHTPLLMLQAEADKRCPAGDNEQFFITLRGTWAGPSSTSSTRRSTTSMHRRGRPDRRIDRHDADARLVRPLPARVDRGRQPSGARARVDRWRGAARLPARAARWSAAAMRPAARACREPAVGGTRR